MSESMVDRNVMEDIMEDMLIIRSLRISKSKIDNSNHIIMDYYGILGCFEQQSTVRLTFYTFASLQRRDPNAKLRHMTSYRPL